MSVPLRQRSARPSAALLPPAYSAPGLDIAIEEEKGIFYRASSATPTSSRFKTVLLSSLLTAASLGAFYLLAFPFPTPTPTPVPRHVARGLNLCKSHDKVYGPSSDFADRKTSDRFVPGTKPVLLTNATIWTGGEDGHEVIAGGEILLDQGIVKFVGQKAEAGLLEALKEYVHVDVKGQWVTPGIVSCFLFIVAACCGSDGWADSVPLPGRHALARRVRSLELRVCLFSLAHLNPFSLTQSRRSSWPRGSERW